MFFNARLIFASILIVLLLSSAALAEDDSGKLGFGIAVAEPSPSIMAQYWVSSYMTISAQFAVQHITLEELSSTTRILPGLGLLYHLDSKHDIKLYYGVRSVFDILFGMHSTYNDAYISAILGAEYFVSSHFSISGEYQFGFVLTHKSFSPSGLAPDATYFVTNQSLIVQYYFLR